MDRTRIVAATVIAIAVTVLLTNAASAKPPAAAKPATQSQPASQQAGGLKYHLQAKTLDELIKKAKPDFTWIGAAIEGVGGEEPAPPDHDLMWITTDAEGKATFRMERVVRIRDDHDKVTAYGLPESRKDYQEEDIAGLSMPVSLKVQKSRPKASFENFAILKGQHPKCGEVYELCWVPEVCAGSGRWRYERFIYVWRDAGGKWHLIGEGPSGVIAHESGQLISGGVGAEVRWRGGQPMVLLMLTSTISPWNDIYKGYPTLETRQDFSLRIGKNDLAGEYESDGGEYLMAQKEDSLDKIVQRFSAWRGPWDQVTHKDKKQKFNEALRKLIQEKNSKVEWNKLKPRERIELPSRDEIDKALNPSPTTPAR